jgi:hypothetical protein
MITSVLSILILQIGIQIKPERCEISWRYLRPEVSYLERNRRIPKVLDIDNIPLF